MPRRTLMDHIKALKKAGYLEPVGYRSHRGKRMAEYRLSLTKLAPDMCGGSHSEKSAHVRAPAHPDVRTPAHYLVSTPKPDPSMEVVESMERLTRASDTPLSPEEQAEKAFHSLPSKSLMRGFVGNEREQLHDLVRLHGLDAVLGIIESMRADSRRWSRVKVQWIAERLDEQGSKHQREAKRTAAIDERNCRVMVRVMGKDGPKLVPAEEVEW